MPEQTVSRRLSSWPWFLLVGCAVLVLVLVLAGLELGGRDAQQPQGSGAVTIRSIDPSDGGGGAASDGGYTILDGVAQPAPQRAPAAGPLVQASPPKSVDGQASLTLPQSVRIAKGQFSVRAGATYLVRFELHTVKPEASPGVGMYLGATLSCSGAGGGTVGGTENLLPGEPVSYQNQMLITPDRNGVVSCNVLANAPYDDVAAAGTTVDLDVSWTAAETTAYTAQTPSEQLLPRTVAAEAREMAFGQLVPVGELSDRTVDVLSTLHVTTCTGTNGSREARKVWCGGSDIEEGGSVFDVELRVDVIGVDGAVCSALRKVVHSEDLDEWRHHQLIHLEDSFQLPENLCGNRLRVSAVVDNQGPAALVVHEANSSLVTAERRFA